MYSLENVTFQSSRWLCEWKWQKVVFIPREDVEARRFAPNESLHLFRSVRHIESVFYQNNNRLGSISDQVFMEWMDGSSPSASTCVDVHTYPLQWYDVFVSQLFSGQRIHHVLSDQLLHALLSHHGTPEHRTENESVFTGNTRTKGQRWWTGWQGGTHEGRRTAQGTLLPRTSLVTAHTYLSWEIRRYNNISTLNKQDLIFVFFWPFKDTFWAGMSSSL